MKKQIRSGVFETNSSSSHSIVITKDTRVITAEDLEESRAERIYVNRGVWDITNWDGNECLEFGRRPFMLLNTFEEKMRYTIASLCGCCAKNADEEFAKIEQIAMEIIPGLYEIKVPMQEVKIWEDADGNEVLDNKAHINWEDHSWYYVKNGKEIPLIDTGYYTEIPYYGYVDHQSMCLLQNFLKDEGITLKEFLVNKKYVVVIDGDEYCDWIKLKYSGLINIQNIEKEY